MKFILSVILCLLFVNVNAQLLPSFGGSRTGTTGYQFLKITPDARAAGLDGCVTAITNDVSALYWNPAGITKLDTQQFHLQISQTKYVAESDLSFIGFVYRINKETFLGASVEYFATPEMNVTTEFQPFGTGQTFRAYDVAAGITYAKILTANFSFGITGKYLREQFAGVKSQNGVVDFGFQYDIGKANTRFAVGISNFGFTTEPSGTLITEDLSGKDSLVTFDKIAVPAIFRIGFAWDAVKNKTNRFTIAGQLNHPTDNNETYNLGAEYEWRKTVFARTGYAFGEDERGLPAFGFGVRYKRNFGMIQLDYGYQFKNRLGSLHRLGLGISIF